MPRRPSVFVLALTVGDYLLWNWSLNGNHDVIALVSGLTLPPLALVSLWVLVLAATKAIAAGARLRRSRPAATSGTPAVPAEGSRRAPARATAAGAHEDTRRIAA